MSTLHIVCPHCHAVNRIPSERLAQHPRCGKCKETLFSGHPLELTGSHFQQHISRSDILSSSISGLPGADLAK